MVSPNFIVRLWLRLGFSCDNNRRIEKNHCRFSACVPYVSVRGELILGLVESQISRMINTNEETDGIMDYSLKVWNFRIGFLLTISNRVCAVHIVDIWHTQLVLWRFKYYISGQLRLIRLIGSGGSFLVEYWMKCFMRISERTSGL